VRGDQAATPWIRLDSVFIRHLNLLVFEGVMASAYGLETGKASASSAASLPFSRRRSLGDRKLFGRGLEAIPALARFEENRHAMMQGADCAARVHLFSAHRVDRLLCSPGWHRLGLLLVVFMVRSGVVAVMARVAAMMVAV